MWILVQYYDNPGLQSRVPGGNLSILFLTISSWLELEKERGQLWSVFVENVLGVIGIGVGG